MTDLLAGVVQLKLDTYATSMQCVEAFKLRVLAYGGRARSPLLSNLPTVAEMERYRRPDAGRHHRSRVRAADRAWGARVAVYQFGARHAPGADALEVVAARATEHGWHVQF